MMVPSGRYGPGDPAATPRGGVEATVRPVLTGRRGLRQRAGIVTVAAVAITVVGAGIGLGGRGTEPRPSGTASASGPLGGAASGSPTASLETTPSPTEISPRGCMPVVPGDLPEIRLWSRGDFSPNAGVPGPSGPAKSSAPTLDWPVPDESAAMRLGPLESLVLIPDEGACIRSAVIEYLGVTKLGGSPTPLGNDQGTLDPPRGRLVIGRLGDGDWIVRVVASLSTGVAGGEDAAATERFFRVISGSGVEPAPLVSPAVPCATLLESDPLPRLYLRVGDGTPVLGVDAATVPGDILRNGAIVGGTFPDRLELLVDGEVCATSWTVEWLQPTGGGTFSGTGQDNPGENPSYVSQNRIELLESPLGRSVVMATLHFGSDRTARAAWELTLTGPPVPAATVTGPGGRSVPVLPGCGTGWTLANGRYGYEGCAAYPVPDGLELLTIRSGDAVRFVIPGWNIESWGASCGTRSAERGEVVGEVVGDLGCGLGDGGAGGPVAFLPFPGRSIVQIGVSAEHEGDHMYTTYFVEILAEP